LIRNIWLVARRELGAIFVQPIAYIFGIVVVGFTGFVFSSELFIMAVQPGSLPLNLGGVFNAFTSLYIFATPAITMRLLSEEQRSGTLELLLTLPLRDGEVILGKFLAAFLFYLMTALLTLIYPLILLNFGNPDVGPILTGYLGVLLWGAALLSLGVLASAFTENQIGAFMLALGFILALYLTVMMANFFNFGAQVSTILNELSLSAHLSNFFQGLILAKDVAYYLLLTAVSLFAAARVLESRRWR